MKSEPEVEDPEVEKALPYSRLRGKSSLGSSRFEDDVMHVVPPRAMREEGLGAVTFRTTLLEEKPLINSGRANKNEEQHTSGSLKA